MAGSDLDKLCKEVLADLEKTGPQKKGKDAQSRIDLVRMPGQVFVLLKKRFRLVILRTIQFEASQDYDKLKENKTNLENVVEDAYKVYKKYLESEESKVEQNLTNHFRKTGLKDSSLTDAVNDRISELETARNTLKGKGEAFLISKYDTIRKSGNKILEEHLKKVFNKSFRIGGAGLKTSENQKYGQQIGHADALTGGAAASSIRLLRAERLINMGHAGNEKVSIGGKETSLKDIIQTIKGNIELTIEHESVIDGKTGNLKKGYVPVLTYQSAWSNQIQSNKIEKGVIESFIKQIEDIGEQAGSLPLKEQIASVTFYNLVKNNPNIKTTGRKNQVEKSSGKGKAEQPFTRKRRVRTNQGSGASVAALQKGKITKTRKSSANSSMISLMALLNKKLPDAVRKNMGAPGLSNVTGTFANSVRITDVSKTAKGFPSIGYTYMKDPYQVFEVGIGGYPWATTERDPRKLIDRSIREIAAGLALGRFYTRRE